MLEIRVRGAQDQEHEWLQAALEKWFDNNLMVRLQRIRLGIEHLEVVIDQKISISRLEEYTWS
jgi:hypothetical protein